MEIQYRRKPLYDRVIEIGLAGWGLSGCNRLGSTRIPPGTLKKRHTPLHSLGNYYRALATKPGSARDTDEE